MDYSSEVRRRFDEAVARGAQPDLAVPAVTGAAGDRSLNVWVELSVGVSDGRLVGVRYNAFGCPHVIAACEWLTEQLEGEAVDALRAIDLPRMARELGIPREKYGKLLRIEDAARECARQLLPGQL